MPNYCIDCRHFEAANEFFKPRCWHPETQDLVGYPPTAFFARYAGECGKDGKYFEPKPLPPPPKPRWWRR